MNATEKALCTARLYHYSRHMFRARKGVAMLENDHQQIICEALERVVTGHTN